MRGIVLPKTSIGYKSLPKTASTSIKHVLYTIRTNKIFKPDTTSKPVEHIHRFFESRQQDISEVDFRFIAVRDPTKRFLSAYSNRVTAHKECSERYLQKRYPSLIEEGIAFNPDLSTFISGFDKYKRIGAIDWHTKPIVDHGVSDLAFFTKVYKIENLSLLEKDLSSITKKKITIGRRQTGGEKKKISDLSENELDFLFAYYAADYELLKGLYSKDRIYANWKKGI